MTVAAKSMRPVQPVPIESNAPRYFNRELSWLEFNRRVLEEAEDPRHPLLERVKFLSIFGTNLDEFFMTRVAGLKQQVASGMMLRSPDDMTPADQLAAIRRNVLGLRERASRCWANELNPRLREAGVCMLDDSELSAAQRDWCRRYFEREVFPVLTPLAFDPSRPFPHISSLSLNLGVVIRDPEEGELFARVKVPAVLPRLVRLGEDADDENPVMNFVWLDQIIAANIGTLFHGMPVAEVHPFRIIRNADVEIAEEEAGDLLHSIERSVRQRRFGAVVRISVRKSMPQQHRELLLSNLHLTPDDLYEINGPLGLADLMEIAEIDRPDLKDPPFYPTVPPLLRGSRSEELFAAIRQQDILLHHPYDSFQPLVELVQAAAEDPNVLAIKQTLYRVGPNSPIVEALMRAREQHKQVTVLVELKARFDEENNIIWARALERAGVHVVYGVMGLKTHAKIALVVRREADGLRRYIHLGTGNYNATTARIYTDLGLLTARPDIGADASDLFNYLTGYSRLQNYRTLLVAPVNLRPRLMAMIQREIDHARRGRRARLIFKCNAVVDQIMIDQLYEASQAGVRIDMIVRGVCALRPGVPGLSENITVRSIVGPFLEHSRIYYFANNGRPEVYLGSADLMRRNLDKRVETLFPLQDARLVRHVRDELLMIYLRDNTRARVLRPDGSYARLEPRPGETPVDSQAIFCGEPEELDDGFRLAV